MADVSKAQKLASARKKFKELKKEKRRNAPQGSAPSSREQTPVENVTSSQENSELPNYFNSVNNGQAFFDTFVKSEEAQLSNYFNEDKNEIDNFQNFDSVKFAPLSSIESLQQVSAQMAELIDPTCDFPDTSIHSQLETRNQELAALLDQEKLKFEELNLTLKQYQSRVTELESQLKEKESSMDGRIEQEVGCVREQLQGHIQTVGILVAEKTELSANLSQFQLAAKQKTAECEELQGRLKTSRSRVADLEREVALLKNEKSHFDTLGREQSSELEKLKVAHRQLKEERDELLQDLLEVREKLKSSSENNLVFQQQIGELSNQLSLANIKIQQLTTGDQVSGQVEELTQQKFALEKQIADLTLSIKTLTKERDESTLQYQQYAQQLNSQLTNMATRLEKLQKENESLQIGEQNRIKHIGELEKQLQNLQNEQVNFAVQRNVGESRAELDAALELVEKLKQENKELEENSIKVLNEKNLLVKDLEVKGGSIRELEGLVEELKGSQPDNAKLLAVMESDKVAAARAVAQNAELKKQMESMQEVFMKVNDDKMELTEKLTSEQRNNKDLLEKLQKTEVHLQTLADAIEIKDKELSNLRENSLELNKQVLQSEQLTDRLRHYEAQDNSSQSLQAELQESRQIIEKLNEEIDQLKSFKETNGDKQEINGDDEVTELRRKLRDLEAKNEELEVKLATSNGETSASIDTNHNNSLDKESAMKHLEQKFLKTMEDIAELTDEKQRLEHLVLQLQGETETIGEYVALYQHQRSLLKQKAIEKDQQLTQLANDREQMKAKLEKLNELVKKLVLEKGAVPVELLEQHEKLTNNQLCEEHAKIHSEINKITQSSLVEASSGECTETAEEIIALLSEIKSSNLVQPSDNFHHCPWCSGQLITV